MEEKDIDYEMKIYQLYEQLAKENLLNDWCDFSKRVMKYLEMEWDPTDPPTTEEIISVTETFLYNKIGFNKEIYRIKSLFYIFMILAPFSHKHVTICSFLKSKKNTRKAILSGSCHIIIADINLIPRERYRFRRGPSSGCQTSAL